MSPIKLRLLADQFASSNMPKISDALHSAADRIDALEQQFSVLEQVHERTFSDLTILGLRLYVEPDSTMSPECQAVMERLRPALTEKITTCNFERL